MRLAFVPICDHKIINADSSLIEMKNEIKSIDAVMGEKNYWYVVLTNDLEGYDYFDDLGNVKVLRLSRGRFKFFDEIDVIDEGELTKWFSPRCGRYPIDALITHKTAGALLLQRLLTDFRRSREIEEREQRIPVIILENRVFGRRNSSMLYSGVEFSLRAKAYANLRWLTRSDFEILDALDASQKYLTPAELIQAEKNGVPLPIQIDKEYYAQFENTPKRERFTCFWGGRMAAQKRPEFIFKVYDLLFRSGYDIDILMTTSHELPIKYIDDIYDWKKINKNFVLLTGVRRDDYLRHLNSCHVAMSASLNEGISMGFIEMAYSGVPFIAPRRFWTRVFLGDDYPLYYDTNKVEDAYRLLVRVYENYEWAKEVGRQTKEKLERLVSGEKKEEIMSRVIKEEYQKWIGRTKPFIMEGTEMASLIDTVLMKLGNRFELVEMMGELIKFSESYSDTLANDAVRKFPSMWAVRDFLIRRRGYVDTCETALPIMVKRDG